MSIDIKKKVVIVSNFYNGANTSRPYVVSKFFYEEGMKVILYTADFNHYTKTKIENKKENINYISVPKYRKNFSFKRIISHIIFALRIRKKLENIENIDILYINTPPNILGYWITKKIKASKIVIDIIDLWPEAMPIKKVFKIFLYPFFKYWIKLRENSLEKADYILTHTNNFYELLNLKRYNYKSKVIYLKKTTYYFFKNPSIEGEKLRIIYIGNISYIYDFDSLIEILKKLKANLEIIGEGPYRDELIKKLKAEKIKYNFYGIIIDEDKKLEIIKNCHFGYNGYKETTEVSMSYKSIDYFSYGLPIINSANGDTWKLIEEYKLGYNFQKNNLKSLIKNIKKLNNVEYAKKCERVKNVFLKYFSYKSYKKEMKMIIEDINRRKIEDK